MVNKQNVWHIGCSPHIFNCISKFLYCDNMFAFIYLDVVNNIVYCIKGKGFSRRKLCCYVIVRVEWAVRNGYMWSNWCWWSHSQGYLNPFHSNTTYLYTYVRLAVCLQTFVSTVQIFYCDRSGFTCSTFSEEYVKCGLLDSSVRICNPCDMSWKKLYYYFNLK